MSLSSQDTKTVSIAWAVAATILTLALCSAWITFIYFDAQGKQQEIRSCYQNKMVWDRGEQECRKP